MAASSLRPLNQNAPFLVKASLRPSERRGRAPRGRLFVWLLSLGPLPARPASYPRDVALWPSKAEITGDLPLQSHDTNLDRFLGESSWGGNCISLTVTP